MCFFIDWNETFLLSWFSLWIWKCQFFFFLIKALFQLSSELCYFFFIIVVLRWLLECSIDSRWVISSCCCCFSCIYNCCTGGCRHKLPPFFMLKGVKAEFSPSCLSIFFNPLHFPLTPQSPEKRLQIDYTLYVFISFYLQSIFSLSLQDKVVPDRTVWYLSAVMCDVCINRSKC